MSEVLVVGAGAWGTALAIHAARAGRSVSLWVRDPARAAAIATARENPRLPGARLPPELRIIATLDPAALTLLAVPMQHLRTVLPRLRGGGPLVCCAKGVETATGHLPLEVIAEHDPDRRAAVLTGPNFAHEIAAGLPAAATVACTDAATLDLVVAALATPGFRLYGSDDPVSAQVGGAAKNVIAIAAGIVIGAGYGENARAALVTRGLAEIARLAVALGGRADTVAGLSGLGDLLLTCAGLSSRNYSLGLALGAGRSAADVLAGRDGVTEGVGTAPALVARAAGARVAMPVVQAVAALLSGSMTVSDAAGALLSRPVGPERPASSWSPAPSSSG